MNNMEIHIWEIEKPQCDICGKEVDYGYTDDHGDFYAHEECFAEYMDRKYGTNNWWSVDDDGAGGYYMAIDKRKNERFGTGAYWTTFECD